MSPPRGAEIDQTLVRELASVLRPPGNGLAVITWSHPCPPCLDWSLVSREGVIDVPRAASVAQAEQTAKVARAAGRWPVPRPLLTTLNRYALSGKARTYYWGGGAPSVLLKELIQEGDVDRVAVVGLGPGPPTALEPLIRAAGPASVSSRWVPGMSGPSKTPPLRLDIYRR